MIAIEKTDNGQIKKKREFKMKRRKDRKARKEEKVVKKHLKKNIVKKTKKYTRDVKIRIQCEKELKRRKR